VIGKDGSLSLIRRYALLDLPRSTFYNHPRPVFSAQPDY
jgi:hypothetical protein